MNKSARKKYVVDTNVPVTANSITQVDADTDVPVCCRMQCLKWTKLATQERIVIDSIGKVMKEYRRYLSPSGEPGVGDHFMRWVCDNLGNSAKVCSVPLTKKDSSYQEFPHSPALAGFDNDDHKFIALANACNKTPVILQATDGEWWKYKSAFERAGIKVYFLCPDFAKEKCAKKYPNSA